MAKDERRILQLEISSLPPYDIVRPNQCEKLAMSSTLPREGDAYSLLNTLATLRIVIPTVLLGVLIVRFVSKGFLSMMGRIQAQGWTPGKFGILLAAYSQLRELERRL